MEWITDNLSGILILLGLALLVVEIAVLGFSIFIVFFFGLGSLLTGLLIYTGILAPTIVNALLSVAVITFIAAVVLWKPLKKMQNTSDNKEVTSDLIGYSFVLENDISSRQPGTHRFSGINWNVTSETDLPAGTEVEVIKTEVGMLRVRPKS